MPKKAAPKKKEFPKKLYSRKKNKTNLWPHRNDNFGTFKHYVNEDEIIYNKLYSNTVDCTVFLTRYQLYGAQYAFVS